MTDEHIQPPLFDEPTIGMVESPAQADTALEAAVAIAPSAASLRREVLAAIAQHGALGLTDEEGIRATGIVANTYRPRRVELDRGWRDIPGGLVRDSGRRRKTDSGRTAVVWVATDEGHRALAVSALGPRFGAAAAGRTDAKPGGGGNQ